MKRKSKHLFLGSSYEFFVHVRPQVPVVFITLHQLEYVFLKERRIREWRDLTADSSKVKWTEENVYHRLMVRRTKKAKQSVYLSFGETPPVWWILHLCFDYVRHATVYVHRIRSTGRQKFTTNRWALFLSLNKFVYCASLAKNCFHEQSLGGIQCDTMLPSVLKQTRALIISVEATPICNITHLWRLTPTF